MGDPRGCLEGVSSDVLVEIGNVKTDMTLKLPTVAFLVKHLHTPPGREHPAGVED